MPATESAAPAAARWNGRGWTVSPLNQGNRWAIGGINVAEDSIVHYLSGAWHHVTAPVLKGLQFATIAATSTGSVWATGNQAGAPSATRLLHLSNRRWASIKVPWNIDFRSMPRAHTGDDDHPRSRDDRVEIRPAGRHLGHQEPALADARDITGRLPFRTAHHATAASKRVSGQLQGTCPSRNAFGLCRA